MIPLSVPSLDGNEAAYVVDCVRSTWVSSSGKYISRFEDAVVSRMGGGHAVAVINGTAALHLALLVTGVLPGDEVIVPTLTFIAPVNAVRYCQAHPVFMDCDEYMNLDVAKVAAFFEERCETRDGFTVNKRTGRRVHSIIPVHVFGNPVDMPALLKLTGQRNIKVIEDATESLGSLLYGRPTGTFGDVGCFSFNGNKLITSGGGGMLVTRDEELAQRARYLATQAKDDELYYVHGEMGYNYRLSNLHAALGLAQIEKLDSYLRAKRENYLFYRQQILDIQGLDLLAPPSDSDPNYWFYTILVSPDAYGEDRNALMKRFLSHDVQVRPVWRLNHEQKPYESAEAYHVEQAPRYYARALNIPCSVGLSSAERDTVVGILRK